MRADARRKRDAILAAAVDVFAERGVDIALDDVARRAGVGIGTLYRHFPSREALITGAYIREIDRLCDGMDELLATEPPDQAAVIWMQRFVGKVAGQPGMALALKTVVSGTDQAAVEDIHRRVFDVLAQVLAADVFRKDVPVEVVAASISGICLANSAPGTGERADQMVRLLVDGLRDRNAAGAPPFRAGVKARA
jgi:AcrR family transcriptional regulator